MKRTFIAVKVEAGSELLKLFSVLKNELKYDSIRWTDPNQIHLTLAFLGDTSEETIKHVSTMLSEISGGISTFSFKISGMGVFRTLGNPRVIWAGIERSDELENLFRVIKSGLDRIGFAKEERSFKPHLTLGRIKQVKEKGDLEKLAKQFDKKVFQEVKVSEIIFYESLLRPTGSVYIPIIISKLND
jgi:RNA 2',3'-cyclic 3'-phosphodiesterase